MKTSGNTVLITGAGSGIGLALAEAFLMEHNTIIGVGRDPDKLAAAKIRCPALHALQADITSEQDCHRLVGELRHRFPDLNILVNNAGAAFFSDLKTDPDAFTKALVETQTNFLAPVRLVQLLLGQLQQQPSAAIINITTIAAYLPMAVMPGYSASKAALHSFTRSLRLQLQGLPIKVFEVLPPPVDTDMVQEFHMPKMSPQELAVKILRGLQRDDYEMAIGPSRALRWLARLAPAYAERESHRQLSRATRRRATSE